MRTQIYPVRNNRRDLCSIPYVIQSKKDGKLYIGSINNLRKRFREHNDNRVFSTNGRGPFESIYYEAYMNEQDARAREH